jgi:hypothetical protein
MSIPSNGITPEVIRGAMQPYRLSPDLMAATIAALPAPPPDSTTTWRQDRITRQLQEIAALKPADAAQAHIAAQILTTRELADAFTARAQAPNLEINQMCRLGRTGAELLRSAAALDRTLARHQQMPTPFCGTIIEDEVDIPALEAIWASGTPAPTSADAPASTTITPPPATPKPAPSRPGPRALVPAVNPPEPRPDAQPTPPPPLQAQPAHSPDPATQSDQPAGAPRTRPAGANWVFESLDQGPGYSREVLRPRTAADPVPEPAT